MNLGVVSLSTSVVKWGILMVTTLACFRKASKYTMIVFLIKN